MQYLLMCCIDESLWESIPQSQRDGVMREYGRFVHDIVSSGHYRGGAKLEASSTAVTVRGRNAKTTVVDGPFAETKEQLGGYHVIECNDLDAALAIAKRIPTLSVGGSVEVRALAPTAGAPA